MSVVATILATKLGVAKQHGAVLAALLAADGPVHWNALAASLGITEDVHLRVIVSQARARLPDGSICAQRPIGYWLSDECREACRNALRDAVEDLRACLELAA